MQEKSAARRCFPQQFQFAVNEGIVRLEDLPVFHLGRSRLLPRQLPQGAQVVLAKF